MAVKQRWCYPPRNLSSGSLRIKYHDGTGEEREEARNFDANRIQGFTFRHWFTSMLYIGNVLSAYERADTHRSSTIALSDSLD
jgi:hypothetical protein